MRYAFKTALLCSAVTCILGAADAAQAPAPTGKQGTVPNFVPVTDAMMRAPKPDDWLMYRGNYQGWGYSPVTLVAVATGFGAVILTLWRTRARKNSVATA